LSPLSLPPRDRKIEPIVDWFDLQPEAPPPAEAPKPHEAQPEELRMATPIAAAPPLAAPPPVAAALSIAAPPPVAAATPNGARRETPPSIVKATMLHLDGQLEQAIQELQAGLRNGE